MSWDALARVEGKEDRSTGAAEASDDQHAVHDKRCVQPVLEPVEVALALVQILQNRLHVVDAAVNRDDIQSMINDKLESVIILKV